MEKAPITCQQLDAWLSQPIKSLYFIYLELELGDISYQLFEDKLIVTIEGTVTQPEHLLNQSNHQQLARQVRAIINKVIKPQLKELIESVMQVNVVEFFSHTTIDTGRTGIIAIFEFR